MISVPALSLSKRCDVGAAMRCAALMGLVALPVHGPLLADEATLEAGPFSDGTEDWRTHKLFTGALVKFYGQFSPSVLRYDDGRVAKTYAPVGNSNRTSRIGLRWHIKPFREWTPVLRAEYGLSPSPSNSVNLDTPHGTGWSLGDTNLRKFELVLQHARYGIFSFGQGSMASDSITEVDYSGTDAIAYSDPSAPASAQFLRLADGTLTDRQVGQFIDNFDGANITGTYEDGNYKLRARYDSPNYNGLIFSVALGNEVLRDDGQSNVDASVTYEHDFGDVKFASGVGFSWQSTARILSGSMSAVHEPTGASVTFAMGGERGGANFSYLKLGLLRDYWAFGQTAMSLDFYQGNDIYSPGSRARSVGLAFVQSYDRFNVQGYALLRRYAFDEPDIDYLNGTAMMAGLRWVF